MAQASDGDDGLTNYMRLREHSFDRGHFAQVVVNMQGVLVLANAQAREMFKLRSSDVGRSFKDLELS